MTPLTPQIGTRPCIHRNSLVYRLNRAQEIAGFDFERPGEVERILFSCEILQYLDSKNGL